MANYLLRSAHRYHPCADSGGRRQTHAVLRSVYRQADRFFSHCRLTMQPPKNYSVGGQRSSRAATGKPAGARPDYRGRWCADQFENLEKHTQWGIEVVEKYNKFVKERSEIEISYAKQIRNLSKKYQPKKNSEDEYKYTSCRAFLTTLNEMNDYAGQHEVIAENLSLQIISELSRYTQELKQERKSQSDEFYCRKKDRVEGKFISVKEIERLLTPEDSQLVIEAYKSGFEPPGDVEFEDYSQPMTRTVSESSLSNSRGDSKPEKSSSKSKVKLWPFKKNKLMSLLTSPHQPPPPPPASASPSPSAVPNGPQSPKQHKEPLSHRFNEFMTSKPKMHCFRSLKRGQSRTYCYHKEHMKRTLGKPTYAYEARQYVGSGPEDFSHLPPEQRRKKLQQKIDDFNKDIQKEMDQRDALTKMKDVYIKNPQMGDPNSVDPRLAEIGQNIEKLQLESQKFEGWLAEVEGRLPVKSDPPRQQSALYETQNSTPVNNNCAQDRESPDGSYTEEQSSESQIKVPTTDFDDEFDDEEPLPTIGNCKALYPFDGHNEGTLSVTEGETLYVIEEDKGDGWTRVRRNEDEEGYVPSSYLEVFLDKNGKGAMTYI
ncbi:UNVERIFIED_CONTAM: hypothetical protein FKN15_029153 [Acipenser sinensis]